MFGANVLVSVFISLLTSSLLSTGWRLTALCWILKIKSFFLKINSTTSPFSLHFFPKLLFVHWTSTSKAGDPASPSWELTDWSAVDRGDPAGCGGVGAGPCRRRCLAWRVWRTKKGYKEEGSLEGVPERWEFECQVDGRRKQPSRWGGGAVGWGGGCWASLQDVEELPLGNSRKRAGLVGYGGCKGNRLENRHSEKGCLSQIKFLT